MSALQIFLSQLPCQTCVMWSVRQSCSLCSHCRRYHRNSRRFGRYARRFSCSRRCHCHHYHGCSRRSDGCRCRCLHWPLSLPQELARTVFRSLDCPSSSTHAHTHSLTPPPTPPPTHVHYCLPSLFVLLALCPPPLFLSLRPSVCPPHLLSSSMPLWASTARRFSAVLVGCR